MVLESQAEALNIVTTDDLEGKVVYIFFSVLTFNRVVNLKI